MLIDYSYPYNVFFPFQKYNENKMNILYFSTNYDNDFFVTWIFYCEK